MGLKHLNFTQWDDTWNRSHGNVSWDQYLRWVHLLLRPVFIHFKRIVRFILIYIFAKQGFKCQTAHSICSAWPEKNISATSNHIAVPLCPNIHISQKKDSKLFLTYSPLQPLDQMPPWLTLKCDNLASFVGHLQWDLLTITIISALTNNRKLLQSKIWSLCRTCIPYRNCSDSFSPSDSSSVQHWPLMSCGPTHCEKAITVERKESAALFYHPFISHPFSQLPI